MNANEYMILFSYIVVAACVTYMIHECMNAVISIYEEKFW